MNSFIKKEIENPWHLFYALACQNRLNFISDSMYVKLVYRGLYGKKLNIQDPKTYNEKLQWLKLNDRKDSYRDMVDKYEAKKYIANVVGEQYIIPTYGVWDRFEDVNFKELPQRFVLKCTHDSGGVIVVTDKEKINYDFLKTHFNKKLKNNFYQYGREWAYKSVKPRIIAEEYMEDHAIGDLRDYKIHCFNGRPTYLQVIGNRNILTHGGNQWFFDFDWNDAGWTFGDYPPYSHRPEKPVRLDEMFSVALGLSRNMKYIRVDLYEIDGKVYCGELTLYPGSGFYPYNDVFTYDTDLMLGSHIDLSTNMP